MFPYKLVDIEFKVVGSHATGNRLTTYALERQPVPKTRGPELLAQSILFLPLHKSSGFIYLLMLG